MGPDPPSATTRSACQPVAALAVAQALSWSGKSVSVDSDEGVPGCGVIAQAIEVCLHRWASGWLSWMRPRSGPAWLSSHPPQGIDEAAPAARQALGCGSQHDPPRRRPVDPDAPRSRACARRGRVRARPACGGRRCPGRSTPPSSMAGAPSRRASRMAVQRSRCMVPGKSSREAARSAE